jgi:hypothetical protein
MVRQRGRTDDEGAEPMSNSPIACTLSITDLAAVKERYREAANHYHATAQLTDASAVISLTGERPYLRSLLDEMVARESECCTFLTFGIAETHAGFEVELRVSGDHEMAFDALRESVTTMFPTASVDERG